MTMTDTNPDRPWWDQRNDGDAPHPWNNAYIAAGTPANGFARAWAEGWNAAIDAYSADQAATLARANGPRTIQVEGQLSLIGDPPAPPVADQVTSAAIAAAEAHADDVWKAIAGQIVRELAAEGATFTSDDVWERLTARHRNARTHEPRALGGIIQAASRARIIRPTGEYRNSARAATHKSPKRVWVGA